MGHDYSINIAYGIINVPLQICSLKRKKLKNFRSCQCY